MTSMFMRVNVTKRISKEMTLSNLHLTRTLAELDRLLAIATPEELSGKPRPNKWSAAEILEHLDKTYSRTARLFEKVLENGELRVQPLNMKQCVAQLVVIGFGHMPRGRKAPDMTLPAGAPPDEVIGNVRADFVRMAELHALVAQRYGKRPIGQHPVLGALNADGWAKFHWVHGHHHFRQIDALLTSGR
jgi:DinB superfamily